jgi:hypothetical protein
MFASSSSTRHGCDRRAGSHASSDGVRHHRLRPHTEVEQRVFIFAARRHARPGWRRGRSRPGAPYLLTSLPSYFSGLAAFGQRSAAPVSAGREGRGRAGRGAALGLLAALRRCGGWLAIGGATRAAVGVASPALLPSDKRARLGVGRRIVPFSFRRCERNPAVGRSAGRTRYWRGGAWGERGCDSALRERGAECEVPPVCAGPRSGGGPAGRGREGPAVNTGRAPRSGFARAGRRLGRSRCG